VTALAELLDAGQVAALTDLQARLATTPPAAEKVDEEMVLPPRNPAVCGECGQPVPPPAAAFRPARGSR